MDSRAQKYTEYKDPFDILNEVRNLGLERIYKNNFARGNRSAIEEDTGQLNAGVGKTFTPAYRLNAEAPSSMFQERSGSGRVLPPVQSIDYQRRYGRDSPQGGERERIGSIAKPLSTAVGRFSSNISSLRAMRREERTQNSIDTYTDTLDPSKNINLAYQNAYEDLKKTQEMAPHIQRLGELESEMGDVNTQMENVRSRIAMTKGIEEFRNNQRQAQGRQVQEQNREGFFKASPIIPSSTEQVYPKGHPMGMLTEPNQSDVSAQAANIYKMKESSTSSPLGSPGVAPALFDVPQSNIPPGETAPYPRFEKGKNTTTLGSSSKLNTPPPPGYNPSQGTPPGPKPMHRRRPR